MKKILLSLSCIAIIAVMAIGVITSCKEETETDMIINPAITSELMIGDEATATITIIADDVKLFEYYKVVNGVRGDTIDVLSELTKSATSYTYDFSYELEGFDDMGTLGFEFKMLDGKNEAHRVGLNIKTKASVQSLLAFYDWKLTYSNYMGLYDLLTDASKAAVHRFNQDGSYEVDLGAAYASDATHYCYWVYKETPNNGDTIAEFRLLSRLNVGVAVIDNYTDYRITSASGASMTMYWDIPAYGLKNIKNEIKSQAKGAFQPYGSAAMEESVNSKAAMDCSNIDEALLTIP
jgi:hypothetical protein